MNEIGDAGTVRRPAQAGRFYPANPERLRREVDACFETAEGARRGVLPRPLGLIVPHAGISYSGNVAAAAWATLRDDPPDTVVIAGTNHYSAGLRGAGVWDGRAWETPLGEVAIDRDLAARIAGLGGPFHVDRAAHSPEHSIEVQVPFLQRCCPAARLVPFLVSCRTNSDCALAGRRLGGLLADDRAAGRRLVLVASSDLAHYPAAEEAEEVDARMLEPIVALDADELARREAKAVASGIPGLVCGLCGLEPVLFSLAAFQAMGARRGEVLAAATSADVPGGDRDRCVGYAAVAFNG